MLGDWDLREKISQLTIPVAYIFGRLDALIPHGVMQCMQERYPQFNYRMIDQAAHMPFLSHQQAFIMALEDVLRRDQ